MTDIKEQELLARIAELEAENAFLHARIAELEQKLSKIIDSHDSKKTSDVSPPVPAFVKPKHHKKRHKKPGQKPGHTGSYRKRPTEADEIIEVTLDDCPLSFRRPTGEQSFVHGHIRKRRPSRCHRQPPMNQRIHESLSSPSSAQPSHIGDSVLPLVGGTTSVSMRSSPDR